MTTSFEAAAASLYGDTPTDGAQAPRAAPAPTPAPVAAPAPAATATQEAEEPAINTDDAQPAVITAEAIAAAVPDAIREARENDQLRKLYSPQTEHSSSIPDNAFLTESIDATTSKAIAVELREMAGDMGARAADVQTLTSAMRDATANPLTDDQRIEAREKAVQMLNAEFNDQARQALIDARKFVAADPRRAALLEKVGDDPRVVLTVARLARAAKARGQL
ncbi:XRE family transcriptional regulator [Ralstonia solanacearum]|nr:XRE family transcriptional regulator [Ralstonia solanacearum]